MLKFALRVSSEKTLGDTGLEEGVGGTVRMVVVAAVMSLVVGGGDIIARKHFTEHLVINAVSPQLKAINSGF